MVSVRTGMKPSNSSAIEAYKAMYIGLDPNDPWFFVRWDVDVGSDEYGCSAGGYHTWLVRKSVLDNPNNPIPLPSTSRVNLKPDCDGVWYNDAQWVPSKKWLILTGFRGTNCSGPLVASIFDLSNPSSPQLIKELATSGSSSDGCEGLVLHYFEDLDVFALVADMTLSAGHNTPVYIVNRADLFNATSLDQVMTPSNQVGQLQNMNPAAFVFSSPFNVVVGKKVYFANGQVLDVANRTLSNPLPGYPSTFKPEFIAASRSRIYIIDRGPSNATIRVYDLNLNLLLSINTGYPSSQSESWHIANSLVPLDNDYVIWYDFFADAVKLIDPSGNITTLLTNAMGVTGPKYLAKHRSPTGEIYTVCGGVSGGTPMKAIIPDSFKRFVKVSDTVYKLVDQNNNPVPNATVYICLPRYRYHMYALDGDACVQATTDSQGNVTIPSSFYGKSIQLINPP